MCYEKKKNWIGKKKRYRESSQHYQMLYIKNVLDEWVSFFTCTFSFLCTHTHTQNTKYSPFDFYSYKFSTSSERKRDTMILPKNSIVMRGKTVWCDTMCEQQQERRKERKKNRMRMNKKKMEKTTHLVMTSLRSTGTHIHTKQHVLHSSMSIILLRVSPWHVTMMMMMMKSMLSYGAKRSEKNDVLHTQVTTILVISSNAHLTRKDDKEELVHELVYASRDEGRKTLLCGSKTGFLRQ